MPGETWLPVPGYEGLYEVSDQGNVRSLDRKVTARNGRTEMHKGKKLRPWVGNSGYQTVALCNGTSSRKRTIHSLVAEAFLGERPPRTDVCHLDGNRANNAADNLRYGTRSENLRDCYSYGGRKGNGKLFREDVLDIKKRIRLGESCEDIAKSYGVHRAAIHHIKTGTAFSYITEEVS